MGALLSAAPILYNLGSDLTPEDYAGLADRWITPELADRAGLRRVDSTTGRQIFGRKHGDLAAILIPNVAPWDEGHVREYRGRLDNPELEQAADGTLRERAKYLQPPERRNVLYFPPGVTVTVMEDATVPVIVTEGEFKTLALMRLATHDGVQSPRFLPVGIPGVWSFRGTVGKTVGPKGDRRDVKGLLPDFDRIKWKDRKVIICFDADSESNAKVRAARWSLATTLIELGATVGYLEWPIAEGKGIDDRLAKVGAAKVLSEITSVRFGDWQSRLLRNEDGKVVPCYDNVALYLEHSPEWRGVVGYNEFTGGYFVRKTPPSPVTAQVDSEIEDHFDVELVRWLERRRVMVKPEMLRRVVDVVARRNSYHPVRDYLESLKPWDGVARIGSWLIDYCGAESSDVSPNRYAMAIGEKFLLSAVKRIFDPGAKCDSILVLEGPQGIGKSTAARLLAGDLWFSDQLADMGSKDASMQLRGVWIVELSELDALDRAGLARAKAFLSQQIERFRVPYGRRIVSFPRQCVFIGTTNADTWMKDETGARRFWPIRCHSKIDLDGLKRDRDQLWAEAVLQVQSGASWWLEDPAIIEVAKEEQAKRYQADAWQDVIAKWLEDPRQAFDSQGQPLAGFSSTRESVTSDDVLHHCIRKHLATWTPFEKTRVGRCLTALGWERKKTGPRTAREYRYLKVSQP